MVSIATWNVNSIRSRMPHLLEWLKNDSPDIVLLQETKCTDDKFPSLEIEELGYNVALHGQKTYNGVAILSKFPLDDITRGLPGNGEDDMARYIEAVASFDGGAVRVASVYVPNGSTTDSDKFPYKLNFLKHFNAHMRELLAYDEMIVIGGDYNIAPYDIDVHDVKMWADGVLTHEKVRTPFRELLHTGMSDAYRICHPDSQEFSWWDYRGGSFAKNNGLRIDHLLLSAQATDCLTGCDITKDLRALEKPSDHTPVVGHFTFS